MNQIFHSAELQAACQELRMQGKFPKIGFVPTMGALHEGHLSLIEHAKNHCNQVVVSIFVNPTQFGKNEDFSKYPRTLENDLTLLKKAKVSVVFTPSANDLYKNPFSRETRIDVPVLAKKLCGKTRKNHFRGVTMVVNRLLNLVQPNTLFLGEKDFQQLVIIKKMISDLWIPVSVVGCPTLREADGLAMSSRNRYLNSGERSVAASIYQSLSTLQRYFDKGHKNPRVWIKETSTQLESLGFKLDYLDVINEKTLNPVSTLKPGNRAVIAAYLGKTRLIDNFKLE